jgi:prepilin peptidase CpaA
VCKLLIADYTLMVVLTVAAISDVRYRKVRNWLTVPAMVVGLSLAFHARGHVGLVDSLKGLAIMLAVGLFVYLIGFIGAGDAKLLTAVGSFVGSSAVGAILLWSAVMGGVMALIVVFVRYGVMGGPKRIASGFATMVVAKSVRAGVVDEKATRLPYSLAIAAGTVLWMIAR